MTYLFITFLTAVVVCVYCTCVWHKNRDKHFIKIALSDTEMKIASDLIFRTFHNTDFDEFVDQKLVLGKGEDVVDRKQFREGYVSTMKRLILSIETDFFIDSLRYQTTDSKKFFSGAHITYAVKPTDATKFYEAMRDNSQDYLLGVLTAREEVDRFKKLLQNDVIKTKFKHYENDIETYFKYGKSLPDDVLTKRINETPYLRVLIFLQDRLRHSPTITADEIISQRYVNVPVQ